MEHFENFLQESSGANWYNIYNQSVAKALDKILSDESIQLIFVPSLSYIKDKNWDVVSYIKDVHFWNEVFILLNQKQIQNIKKLALETPGAKHAINIDKH